MKNLLLLLMIASMFCTTKLAANVLNETSPVIPYTIDFTQTGSKPDEANASWTYDKWAKMHPSDWLHGFWNNIVRELTFYGAEGKIKSGITAAGMHDSSGDADAWLISPGLYLEEGKSYEITYTYKRFPGTKIEGTQEPLLLTEKFEVGIGNEKTTESLQKRILNTYEVNNDEYETGKSTVSIENSGIYYIGIHLISEKVPQNGGTSYLCLGNFSIKEQIIVNPSPVTSLSVTPNPDKKLSAHLSWKNPTQWSNGENIHENVDAEIYRNEELIKTLTNIAPGTVSEYEDTEIPKAGIYEYAVRIKIGDKYSIKTKSGQQEIGSLLMEASLPYRIDFTQLAPYGKPDETNTTCTWEKWVKVNPSETSAGVWAQELAELTKDASTSGICAYCSHTGKADAWTISPFMLLEKGKAYAVSYSYKKFPETNAEYKERFEISIGTEKTAEALSQKIIAAYEVSNKDYRSETMVIQVEETAEYCIGFHCISEATANDLSYLCLGNFSIEETVSVRPQPITGYSVKPNEMEMFIADLSWTNPTKGTREEILKDKLTVKIFRDDQLIETFYDTEPGAKMTWSDKAGKAGKYVYSISVGWRGVFSEVISLGSCSLEPFVPMRISDVAGTAEGRDITLTWTNPSFYSKTGMEPTNIPLPDKLYIDIYRDTEIVGTIENQAPGSKGEYKDKVTADEKYMYWVTCRLEDGTESPGSNIISINILPVITPSAVVNLTAQADPKTELQVNVSWTNPTKGTKDENLSGKQFKALIFKDEQLVETLLYLDAGSETQWSDQVDKAGSYVYAVALELDKVYSDTVNVTCDVEYFKPAGITDFAYKIEDEKCVLQWKAPQKYENGNELKENMSVNLYGNEKIIATFDNQPPGSAGEYKDELKDGDKKTYFITVTLPNGTSSAKSETIVVNYTSGIDTGQAISTYYDGTTETLYIRQATDVTVYSSSGVCMLRKTKFAGSLSLKELPSATYIVKLGSEKTGIMKLIK